MKVTVAQFATSDDVQRNADQCREFMTGAAGSDLLVLPEAVLIRDPDHPERRLSEAQPLDGPFLTSLLAHSRGVDTAVVVGITERSDGRLPYNTAVALRNGEILAVYRKIHLYDAFGARESDQVLPGEELPPVFDCAGWSVGVMTCYDVRFPEIARSLVDRGAELIALPAAWEQGIDKERHWELMVAARALENTCFVAAAGACGLRKIGASMVVDPLAVVLSRLGGRAGAATMEFTRADLDRARAQLPVLANRRMYVAPEIRPVA